MMMAEHPVAKAEKGCSLECQAAMKEIHEIEIFLLKATKGFMRVRTLNIDDIFVKSSDVILIIHHYI